VRRIAYSLPEGHITMNTTLVRNTLFAGIVTFSLAACGDDDGVTNVGADALSATEREALAEAVAGAVVATFDENPGVPAQSGPQQAVVNFEETVSITVPCDLAGSVLTEGDLAVEFDDVTQEGTVEYTVTQTHQGCRMEAEDDIVFTLDGAPSVTADLFVEFGAETLFFEGSFEGGVDWVTGDREGTCQVSAQFSADINPQTDTGSAELSGTVCGNSFSRSLTVS